MFDKFKDNPRLIVASLITAGVIALALGNNTDNNDTANTDKVGETETSLEVDGNNLSKDVQEETDPVIGSEPVAGPVEVDKEEAVYKATIRSGDNQTVVARQMVNEYLGGQSQSLSIEQRLFVETVVVDSFPRNDVIFVGDVIEVDETVIADAVAASGELTEVQIAAWAAYL